MSYAERIYSPDRTYFAQVSESNGGATTGFVTSVNVVDAKSLFRFSTIFSSRTGDSKWVFETNGSLSSMKVKWINNNSLLINYTNCTEEYGSPIKHWRNIKISYQGGCNLD